MSNLTAETTITEINTYCALILVEDLNMIQTEAAKVLEVTNRTIHRYVKEDRKKINENVLKKIRKDISEKLKAK